MNKSIVELSIATAQRAEFVDITARVQAALDQMPPPRNAGAATIFVPHTTAGITINENADPDVVADITAALDKLVPWRAGYRHGEGNSAAHIKASLMGSSVTVPLRDGKMALGTWQGIYFCEFDGPRQRAVLVTAH